MYFKNLTIKKNNLIIGLSLLIFSMAPSVYALGNVTGKVTVPPDMYPRGQRIEFSGPGVSYKNTTDFGSDGSYSLTGLIPGSYNVYYRREFGSHPLYETKTNFNKIASNVVIYEGENTDINFIIPVGTFIDQINFQGSWGVGDFFFGEIDWINTSASGRATATIRKSQTDEKIVIIGSEGNWVNWSMSFQWNDLNLAEKWDFENLNLTYNITERENSSTHITEGEEVTLASPTRTLITSETLVGFQVDSGIITRVEFHCGETVFSGCLDYPSTHPVFDHIGISGRISHIVNPGSTQLMKIRGIPGTYQMRATITTIDPAQTIISDFIMVLSEPVEIPVDSDEIIDFTDENGTNIGSLDFNGNVTEAGKTTFSELTEGPNPAEGFKIFSPGGIDQYFDVSSTAVFNGLVQVCVNYDDSSFSSESAELALALSHYVYNEATRTGVWVDITEDSYPDATNNIICGLTDSFSPFAIIETPDSDGDGVPNSEDNCPLTANPGQENFDEYLGDLDGDACDEDNDGDGLNNDEDKCPLFYSQDNNDLDDDGMADPCDSDKDGDGIDNEPDNCETVANENQKDFDEDGLGDFCDPDSDEDSVLNADDFCFETELGSVVIKEAPVENMDNGCTSEQRFEQECPLSGEYKNHGKYVSCVVDEAERQVSVGMLNDADKGDVVSEAAQSEIGKK